ncbi:MAG: hypothetical protein ACO1N9_00535 [Flavobacterium sp.]
MEDLLREDDFLQKPHNPWKYFRWFFVASAVERAAIYFLMFFASTPLNFIGYLTVLVTVFVMFYNNKENFYIPSWQIFLAVFIFFMIQLFTTLLLNILNIAGREISFDVYVSSFIDNLIFWSVHAVIIGCIIWYISQLKKIDRNHKLGKL